MIVLDIETSGLYPDKHGIWQIGALDFYNPENIFFEEARIDEKDEVSEGALKVTGKTEAELRDRNKQSQRQLIENLLKWTKTARIKNIASQNSFDSTFINYKARKYQIINNPNSIDPYSVFPHRSFDLHSIASSVYHRINGEFLIKDDRSDMGLTRILEFCGLEDKRIKMDNERIVEEGAPHNALEDAKLTAECLSRLLHGENLLSEYQVFSVPDYLKK